MFCPNPACPHFEATGEPAEFRLGISECSDCGTALVERRPEPGVPPPVEYGEFVPILELRGPAMVAFAKSLLQSSRIRFFIKDERVQDLIAYGQFGAGFNPITGPPTVFVEPSRAEEARELLAGMEQDGARD